MDTRGYICTDRAEVSGSTVDLEFEPKTSGRPIIAEAKHRGRHKQGLSPKKYKEGFAEYFIQWANRPEAEFHFFISKESNPQLWRDLFSEDPDTDAVQDYFDDLQEDIGGEVGEELSKYDVETFEDFAADTTIWNWDYVELTREADRAEQKGDLDYEPYLTAYPPIEDGTGRLSTNLFEVTRLPSTIYRWATEDGLSPASFYGMREHRRFPVELDEGYLYSLFTPGELSEPAAEVTVGQPDEQTVSEVVNQDGGKGVDLVKSLLHGLITYYATEVAGTETDERQNGRVTVLYMPLSDPESREKATVDGRWLAKNADGHDVVRHRAVEVSVKRLAGQFFYALMPKQEFTQDGATFVRSEYKEQLVDDFSKSRYPQNDRTRKNIETWGNVLNPGESVVAYETIDAVRELEFRQVDGIQTDCRPPEDSSERADHIEKL
jgi:hypothetical protein